MAIININIDFKRYTSHPQLVADLSPAFTATVGDTVDFQVYLNTYYKMLYSDLLMLVTTTLIKLRSDGITVTGGVHCDDEDAKSQYASRVNFFKLLELDYEEKFERRPSAGKFTEITPYNKDTIKNVFENIRRVLIANVEVAIEVQQMLDYCMYEIMDNVINHSDYPNVYEGKGWCCAQLFPKSNEIRLIICDTGVGIHKALTTPEKSKYKHLKEMDAVQICTAKGVTNGEGLGFGLFATSEFIKENGGEMLIYSGHYFSHLLEGIKQVNKGEFWHGTFVFMRINTNIPVDYKRIMPEGHSLPEDYQFFLDQMQGINDDLW
ncbi:MAG: ATP-binding protein [Chitinophagaceae bacterium]|nr:ATP-binding protein [Chitinophagaceae bacterium]